MNKEIKQLLGELSPEEIDVLRKWAEEKESEAEAEKVAEAKAELADYLYGEMQKDASVASAIKGLAMAGGRTAKKGLPVAGVALGAGAMYGAHKAGKKADVAQQAAGELSGALVAETQADLRSEAGLARGVIGNREEIMRNRQAVLGMAQILDNLAMPNVPRKTAESPKTNLSSIIFKGIKGVIRK